MISSLCGNGIFEVQNVGKAVLILCVSYDEELCGAAFTAIGEQDAYYFDDRSLSNEDSVADFYASSPLLGYKAKSGYVSVIGSASLCS